ncbi:hypothetical protein J2Z76_001718 [Sedimentibacter acidaminivorans]|uniref:Uncharacterized protein n=1 Tax=Sedimentibacter acidaminivorans TaxID=913099 RepID=A0ABS4GEC7_9FIRM|nr:hypothetical protein [Sedimentibacter acidaminivorans]MBP1925857.1 hypothetical protein [Sedimentibacter acidaminivorans]
MKRNRKDYDKYISIIDETINVNWNFREQYEKIVDGIIEAYEKEKIESSNNEKEVIL